MNGILQARFFMQGFTKKYLILLMAISLLAPATLAKAAKEARNELPDPFRIPYERPIGFSLNVGSLLSGTFEGRFHLGLFPHIVLVVAPSYQVTPELPLPDFKKKEWAGLFQFQRAHLGAGFRAHFYDYDSWNGPFIELMGRAGKLWLNKDASVLSVIPSLMIGYAVVYESGYGASFGLGVEYEHLVTEEGKVPESVEKLQKLYWGITKVPLIGELSIGWTW